MQSKLQHPELGDLTLKPNARARRISLRVLPSGEVRVSYPTVISTKEALRFVESKKQWVLDAKNKLAKARHIIEMPYQTCGYTLKLIPAPIAKFTARVSDKQLLVSYPERMNHTEVQVQDFIKRALEELWRKLAKNYLPQRTSELAQKHGFSFGKVTIRNTHSRWGSCSARDDISLSLSLMRLPMHLIDYILLHELSHTVHKNHGSDFYKLLDKVCAGKHKELNAELKRLRP